ncbi:NAD(P)-binding Rossmann-fold superfamily protein [Klebsormidium nitens]|uniref:NAD(P)-binding Rossmann-fold superfamily protein n=1 Tax=Klebsormidium nitens TaxID=105231 RepID=A0A1Y1HQ12_KLENI|nr:NAD(P)-binding Rossmann-fold superfamily protein [Klebsormidium nitens]|eukprot:GAQ79289.1 NAD(P)-binding Rossmann-fold superfamily protein [Klebsormidium nitens]
MTTPQRLKGLACVITGGASGIERSTAKNFVEHGAEVIIADRQVELGEAVAKELGPAVTFVRCDVTKEADVAAAVDAAIARHGRLDVMFNNAGVIGERGPIDQARAEDFDASLGVNLRSVFLGIKHAARVMKERGTGCILNTASVVAVTGGRGPHGYAAAKAGVVGLTQSTARELRAHNVRVNCILPGAVVTPLTRSLRPETHANKTDEQVGQFLVDRGMGFGGRHITPDDIANLAVFLASPDSCFITGQGIVTDGGMIDLYKDSWDMCFGTREEVAREAGC